MSVKQKAKQIFAAVVERPNRKLLISASLGKIGGTAGFTVRAANNTDYATVAASQTAGKFVLPINGLKIGDKITGFNLVGMIDSAGNAVTVDVDLRKSVSSVAGSAPVDSSIATMTQLSASAQTVMGSSNTSKTLSSAETVSADTNYYLLITVTTGASTSLTLSNGVISLTEQ